MTLKDPKELLKTFMSALSKISGHDQIEPADRNKMASDLTEVYNYLSTCSREPSIQNYFHTKSAQDARIAEQLTKERESLHEHQRFVENNFGRAEQYLRAIQLGGYAVFFALWSLTGGMLDPFWKALAALLVIVSATVFVIWEVSKSTILTFSLKHSASMVSGKIEDFLQTRVSKLTQTQSAELALAKSRPTVWVLTILPAGVAVAIMLCQLLVVISRDFLLRWWPT